MSSEPQPATRTTRVRRSTSRFDLGDFRDGTSASAWRDPTIDAEREDDAPSSPPRAEAPPLPPPPSGANDLLEAWLRERGLDTYVESVLLGFDQIDSLVHARPNDIEKLTGGWKFLPRRRFLLEVEIMRMSSSDALGTGARSLGTPAPATSDVVVPCPVDPEACSAELKAWLRERKFSVTNIDAVLAAADQIDDLALAHTDHLEELTGGWKCLSQKRFLRRVWILRASSSDALGAGARSLGAGAPVTAGVVAPRPVDLEACCVELKTWLRERSFNDTYVDAVLAAANHIEDLTLAHPDHLEELIAGWKYFPRKRLLHECEIMRTSSSGDG